ncbi:hypothetical protein CHUAL_000182 [Chamberlinius hualienensis]
MGLLGHLMIFAFIVVVKAQSMQWKDIDNNCTRLKAGGNETDIIGTSETWYWSYPSDKCITLMFGKIRNTLVGRSISDNKNDVFYSTSNPNNDGQFEEFSKYASIPKVGFAAAVCDFKPGNVPIRLYVMGFESAKDEDIEKLTTAIKAVVPDVALNPVAHGEDC